MHLLVHSLAFAVRRFHIRKSAVSHFHSIDFVFPFHWFRIRPSMVLRSESSAL